jgi:putative nucleotidyltransferase with HDIG domain
MTTTTTTTSAHLPADIVRGIRELEPFPETARQLVALLNGEDVSLVKVAEIIEYDQAIAASVLRTAGSVAYAGWQAPTTVREAVIRIGTVPLLNLVLGDYMARLRHAAPLYDLTEDDLWAHGAASQLAVEAIAAERPSLKLPPVSFTAALLHDVGKLITGRYLKASVMDVVTRAGNTGKTFVEAERDMFGTDHAEVGAVIAREWQFPEVVLDAIARHHETNVVKPSQVLDAVIVANLVAKTIGVGLGAEGFNFAVDGPSARRLRLDYPTFANVCLRVDERLRDLRRQRK